MKVRAGWDEKSINAAEITRIAEQAGAKAITFMEERESRDIKGLPIGITSALPKQAAKKILVIGNGDVFDAESALKMFAYTNCDAVLVARGTMGQPWIAEDILRAQENLPPIQRTVQDIRKALIEHFELIVQYQPEKQSLLDMRRVGCWYLKRCEGAKNMRMQLNKAASTQEVFSLIEQFPWETMQLSQVRSSQKARLKAR